MLLKMLAMTLGKRAACFADVVDQLAVTNGDSPKIEPAHASFGCVEDAGDTVTFYPPERPDELSVEASERGGVHVAKKVAANWPHAATEACRRRSR